MMLFSRSRPSHIIFLIFTLFAIILSAVASSSPAAAQPSPYADTDLICHTSNPKDCYPRIFQPTEDFQTVHDDQQLPNGLHVRVNIWTGKKEAKINVPGEEDASLEGLPVDRGIVLVEPEQPDAPQVPNSAPIYEAIGKVKEPEPGHESLSFSNALKMLKNDTSGSEGAFDDALEGLEEISHDIYYGLKIAEDPEVLRALFCLMADHSTPSIEEVTPRDQQAAAIIGSALQNNPLALKEVAQQWDDLMASKCPRDGTPLRQGFYSTFVPAAEDTQDPKLAASKAKATVAAINGLIKDDGIRAEFLRNAGMQRLLEVLMMPENQEWAGAQRKAGQLVLDNFLDTNMGARLGQWPRASRWTDEQCRAAGSRAEEGCWDYHVERIMRANKRDKGHWSKDLHDRLKAARKGGASPPEHVEL